MDPFTTILLLFIAVSLTIALPLRSTINNVQILDPSEILPNELYVNNLNNFDDGQLSDSDENELSSNRNETQEENNVINPIDILNSEMRNMERNTLRPGMRVDRYIIEIEPNGARFEGTAELRITITDQDTREDPLLFHSRDLIYSSVRFSIAGGSNFQNAAIDVDNDDGTIEVDTNSAATTYTIIFEYTGRMDLIGIGMFAGNYGNK